MKKTLFILLASLFIGVIVLLTWLYIVPLFRKQIVRIAVVAPLSGDSKENGEAMLKGINLCLDTLQTTGKLKGKKIELQILDDQGDAGIAANVAAEIARENTALLVLGHYYSSTSLAAGPIYRRNEIPVITASATTDTVTLNNEWYFRIIPNNSFQAEFLANYLKNLQKRSVRIIFDEDSYGSSLAESFSKPAQKSGIDIQQKWGIKSDDPNLKDKLAKIATALQDLDESGAIFFATYDTEAVNIISSLRYPRPNYAILGPDSFSTVTFIEEFNKYPQQQGIPGHYSDGVYAVSPFMIEVANQNAWVFRQEFVKRYQEEPTWEAACYYDAMAIGAEAIERAEIRGKGHIRSDRQKIRDALAGFYSFATSFPGITGDLYFNANGDVAGRPLIMGVYYKKKLLPALSQYQFFDPSNETSRSLFEGALQARIIQVGEGLMTRTQVVYTGIHINDVSNLDTQHATYTVDFYLWFRFQEAFDDNNIQFTNAINPITLDKPIREEVSDNVTTRIYHVKGDFKGNFDFSAYPFDIQGIPIKFRHVHLTGDRLMYVPDALGMPSWLKDQNVKEIPGNAIAGWRIKESPMMFQEIISNISTLGNPDFFDTEHTITFSQFHAVIEIERANLSVIIPVFAFMIAMVVTICMAYFLPSNWLGVRILLLMSALIVNTFFSITLLSDIQIDYLISINYVFFIVYGLIMFSLFISISAYAFYRRRLALVQGIYLFKPFSEKVKSALSKKVRRRRFRKPGQTIIRQGDRGDSLFGIIEGEVSVWVKLEDGTSLEVAHRKMGDFIGEMALLTGEARTADVISATPALLGEITKADLTPFLKTHPELVKLMSEELTRRKIAEALRKGQQVDEQAVSAKLSKQISEFYGFT
jgi:branched-chain amino acid transport system substrate-binding protein